MLSANTWQRAVSIDIPVDARNVAFIVYGANAALVSYNVQHTNQLSSSELRRFIIDFESPGRPPLRSSDLSLNRAIHEII